ncbi:MAG: hypothetical protein KDA85_14410, partial [Planctomycetaceae bacterium]|nr:hypothetical protein [Planctomycetaceae bacterium]
MEFRRCLLPCLLAATTIVALASSRAGLAQSAISIDDSEFVRELLSRGLVRVARNYCYQRIDQATSPDEKAGWQLLISDSVQQSVWVLSARDRSAVLHDSVESITIFLQEEAVTSATDVRLRTEQIESLILLARFDDLFSQAGHQMPAAGQASDTIRVAMRAISTGIASGTPTTAEESTMERISRQAVDSARGLLRQLELNADAFESSVLREMQENLRLLLCEALLLQVKQAVRREDSQRSVDARSDIKAPSTECGRELELLIRGTSDQMLKSRACLFAAELPLELHDFATAELRLSRAQREAATSSEQLAGQLLRIRLLLAQRESGRARDVIDEWRKSSGEHTAASLPTANPALMPAPLLVAELETSLAAFEIAKTLGDQALQQKSEQEFQERRDSIQPRVRGVWLDLTNRIVARFHWVSQVGPPAADAMEQLDQWIQTGDLRRARAAAELLLKQLPGSVGNQTRGALLLIHGDLAVRLKDWMTAVDSLASAERIFLQLQDSDRAASASLLYAFALAHQTSAVGNVNSAYEAALRQHLERYRDHRSADTARQWLANLLQVSDPAEGVVELLAGIEQQPDDTVHRQLLSQAATLLFPADLADLLQRPHLQESAAAARFAEVADSRSLLLLDAKGGEQIGASRDISTILAVRLLLGMLPNADFSLSEARQSALFNALERDADDAALDAMSNEQLQLRGQLLALRFAGSAQEKLDSRFTAPLLQQLEQRTGVEQQAALLTLLVLLKDAPSALPRNVLLAGAIERMLLVHPTVRQPAGKNDISSQFPVLQIAVLLAGTASRIQLLDEVLTPFSKGTLNEADETR